MEIDERLQARGWTDILWPVTLVVIAWSIILIAFASGQAKLIDHDYLLGSSHWPWLLALGVFLVMWQVMTIAMMLPALLPLFTMLGSMSYKRSALWLVQGAFIVGYATVWTGFAVLAFLGDTLIHCLVALWFWLYLHSWIIGTTTLALAGIFQLCALKRNCLRQCWHPYRRNVQPQGYDGRTAWAFGVRYGRACVGSCWALMLVMFGLGMKNLLWIAVLAAVIALEKGVLDGQRVRVGTGILFLLLAGGYCLFSLWYPYIAA